VGIKDNLAKAFMGKSENFADAFNFVLYNGEKVIQPEKLRELSENERMLIFYEGKAEAKQKYRDLMKSAEIMRDDESVYVLLGIENQIMEDYTGPLRVMSYDVLQYVKQVEILRHKHKVAGDLKSSEDFLSGFTKTDRLIPVITIIVYFDPDEWSGPRSLHGMMGDLDERIKPFVQDYKVQILEPAAISDNDFIKFESELGQVMKYIKASKSKAKLEQILNADDNYKAISRDAAMLLNILTKSELNIGDAREGETVDMCKAMEEIREEAREAGMEKGMILTDILFNALEKADRLAEFGPALKSKEKFNALLKEFNVIV